MRVRSIMLIAFSLGALAACGGAKATVTAIPSAGTLPLVATLAPTATAVASAAPLLTDVKGSPSARPGGTPTALGTPAATAAARAASATSQPAAASSAPSPRPTQPAATAAQAAKPGRAAELPAAAPQQVIGTASDGLTLLNLRAGKNEGFTRLVFDLSKQDGSAAPVPRTRVWTQGSTIIVAFGGVRDDLYAQSLGGAEQHVDLGTVQSVYRIPVRDDTETAYGISVAGPTRVTLSSATLPTRVIVDIADK